MKQYLYIGPKHILDRVAKAYEGLRINTEADIINWIKEHYPKAQMLTVTFVIDQEKNLRIADRHSEHVQCAFGQPVLSAGEMTFEMEKDGIEVIEISNQSTGYCPHKDSWPLVQNILNQLGIAHPGEFTNAFTFGYCDTCRRPSILKDIDGYCSGCGSRYRQL